MIRSGAAKPSRILVVALDNLGDLVFASALTPPLRAAFPDATIDVWSKTYTAPIARLIPHVATVIDADPPWAVAPGMPRPGVSPLVAAVRAVRARRYDVAILSAAPWRTAAAVAAARIPVRIGLARHRNRFFLTDVLPPEDKHRPVLLEQARLLEPLGIASAAPRYSLDAGPIADLRARLAARLPARFAAFHPFASTRARCVPLDEWIRVAAVLAARGVPVLWIGTSRDLDELRRLLDDPSALCIDRIEDGSLAVTAAALSRAAFFAGHDSGPLHVAGAFGVPVVGVFAPGEPRRTFPQGTGPSRLLARATPAEIGSAEILREIEGLHVISAT